MNIAITSQTSVVSAPLGELCNLLQVAASALHLLDLTLDDELRPLSRAGLVAIRQAAESAHSFLPTTALQLTRSIS